MRNSILAAAMATAIVAGLGLPSTSWAEEKDLTVTEYTFRRLDKAQKALEQKKYAEAIKACNEVLARRSINDYERTLALQTRAYVHVERSKLGDAVKDMKAAAEMDALPEDRQTELFFNIGQILLSMEKPKQGIPFFEKWRARAKKPSGDALYTVAVAYAQTNRFENALKYIDGALRAKGRKAPTNWKELKLAALVQLKRWAPAIVVLTDLVEVDFENVTRWKQLSALYSEAGRQPESVAVLEAMFWHDIMTDPKDIVLLARNLLASDVPDKAARILERSMKRGRLKRTSESLELLGTAYVAAADRKAAVTPLLAAAKRSKGGRLYKEVGQLYIELERFSDATKHLRRAIAAGGLRQPGQAYILLGVAEYRLKRTAAAKAAFKKAATFKDGKSAARSWLGFIGAGS